MKSCLCKVFSKATPRINTEDGCSPCHILTDLMRSHNVAPGFEATADILVGCYSLSQPAAMVCRSLCVLNSVLLFLTASRVIKRFKLPPFILFVLNLAWESNNYGDPSCPRMIYSDIIQYIQEFILGLRWNRPDGNTYFWFGVIIQ